MAKILFYCTKAKPYITYDYYDKKVWTTVLPGFMLNGKIVAECNCDLVEEISCYSSYKTKSLSKEELYKASCLTGVDMHRYLRIGKGYALHLSNVKVLDNPKELINYFEFQNCYMNSFGGMVYSYYPIIKAPQNMRYAYGESGNRYILISIRPEYLAKIISGEKTIEVRRRILKDLKELIR